MKIQNKKNPETISDKTSISIQKKSWKHPELSNWNIDLDLNNGLKYGLDGALGGS